MRFSFDSLPISTLIGADSQTFSSVTRSTQIDHRWRYMLTKCCQRLLNPLYSINSREASRIELPQIVAPLFIIGHWRSGTTLLHNLMSRDPQFGYCTTYQTIFPHLMFRGGGVAERLMAAVMPSSRPKDNSLLTTSQPQEEEFAIANMTAASYYHAWIFPRNIPLYRSRYLLFDNCSERELREFCHATIQVMQTALYCQGKGRFLSKNPPHTARIPILMHLFPDAKFIYIHRNRRDVIRSTKEFFRQTTAAIALQDVPTQWLDNQVVETYDALIGRYNRDKHLIPKGSLCEVAFDRLIAQSQGTIEYIYDRLGL
ncbi:MAG: sulfotransferase [Alistipes sp.]|nr:sulfotransferase [Alistipes sp.]